MKFKAVMLILICMSAALSGCGEGENKSVQASSQTSSIPSQSNAVTSESVPSENLSMENVSDIISSAPPVSSAVTSKSSQSKASADQVSSKSIGISSAPNDQAQSSSEIVRYAVAFDPKPYVDYAIEYGTGIGLEHNTEIGTGNWNAWINLYGKLFDKNMKEKISTELDDLKKIGCRAFKIGLEEEKPNVFRMYVYFG